MNKKTVKYKQQAIEALGGACACGSAQSLHVVCLMGRDVQGARLMKWTPASIYKHIVNGGYAGEYKLACNKCLHASKLERASFTPKVIRRACDSMRASKLENESTSKLDSVSSKLIP